MSELKAMTVLNVQQMGCYDNVLVYLKSEADKEISDLKQLNHDLCERVTENDEIRQHWEEIEQTMAENARLKAKLAEQDKELRHQKYKRCLDMAKRCYSMDCRMLNEASDNGTYFKESWCWKRASWYGKWKRKWLELAEKFKEAK